MPSLEQIVEQLGSSDQAQAYRARQALVKLISEAGAPGKNQQREELAAALAKALVQSREVKDPKKPNDKPQNVPALPRGVRGQVARALASVAGESEVPALKAALADFEVREMARWALDRMACQGATDALVEAATKGVGVEFRVGAINALGKRNGSNATAALRECVKDSDYEIRLAAVEALANHADAANDEAIAGVSPEGPAGSGRRVNKRVARSRIRLADRLAKAGQKDAAKRIFAAVAAGKADDAQKKAAKAALADLG